jgi:hypothetical protein
MEASKQTSTSNQNAVKLIGEAVLPGASLLMEGEILAGGAHLLLGWAARAVLGPIGLAVVIANSYSRATTGKGLLKQFSKNEPAHQVTTTHTPTPAPTTTTTIIKPVS